MKVDIKHSTEETGFLKKTTHYVVTIQVVYSEEETAIIEERRLVGDLVLERGVPSNRSGNFDGIEHIFNLDIGRLKDDAYAFTTPLEAKQYDTLLREKMKEVKEYIMGNAEAPESSSFEL